MHTEIRNSSALYSWFW